MSEQPKPQFPRPPMNFNPNYPGLTPEQLKLFQANYSHPGAHIPPPPNFSMPNTSLMNPRLFQHYANNLRMMPVPPAWPYMPYGRAPPMGMHPKEMVKMGKEGDPRFPMPPSHVNHTKTPQPVINVDEEENKKRQQKSHQKKQKPMKKEGKKKAMTSQPFKDGQEKVQATKTVKHSSMKKYEADSPKKKYKKEYQVFESYTQRETREKKQTIEKIMIQVMKERPVRDRMMKIGKDYQAILPESYINEFEYHLKVKMDKKASLMNRMVTSYAT